MDKLTIGQRIDVYECVDVTFYDEVFPSGFQAISIRESHSGNGVNLDPFDGGGSFLAWKYEVKKIGTFIVKSLKGVSNA